MNPYTVIGKYSNGKTVIVHCSASQQCDARRAAVHKIAFDVYDGQIPDGLGPMNEAIGAVSSDFELVAILEGHVAPVANHLAPHIFHNHGD